MLCRIDVKEAFRQIAVDPLHTAKFGYIFGEYAVVDLFLQFGWRSSPGYWDLVASTLEHAYNQTSSQDAVVSRHGRSDVAHAGADADSDWETMSIPPDRERVPSAGAVAGSPGAGRETMPIPPDCKRVPGSGVTADATDGGSEMMSLSPDRTHKPGAGVAAGDLRPGDDADPVKLRTSVWYRRWPRRLFLCAILR